MTLHPYKPIFVRMSAANVPISFRWRGLDYRVDFIDRIWRQAHGRQRDQRLYRVRSRRYTFVLHHDRLVGRWTMIRSPWRVRFGLFIAEFVERTVVARRASGMPMSGTPF